MDLTGLMIQANQQATYYQAGYEASEAEKEEIKAKAKKLNWIAFGASALGAVAGVMIAKSKGKSKLAGGLLGYLIVGTLTIVIGSVLIAKKQ